MSAATFARVTKWIAFVGGILTFIVGIIHITNKTVKLRFPKHKFHDDNVSLAEYRAPLFTFEPNTFADSWTPIVIAVIAIIGHLGAAKIDVIFKTWLRFFFFTIVHFLFANFGYAGGLGPIVGFINALVALLALICVFLDNGSASLELSLGGGSSSVSTASA